MINHRRPISNLTKRRSTFVFIYTKKSRNPSIQGMAMSTPNEGSKDSASLHFFCSAIFSTWTFSSSIYPYDPTVISSGNTCRWNHMQINKITCCLWVSSSFLFKSKNTFPRNVGICHHISLHPVACLVINQYLGKGIDLQ